MWNSVLCTLGYGAGSAWQSVTADAEWISNIMKCVIIATVLVAAVLWIVKRIVPKLRERKSQA